MRRSDRGTDLITVKEAAALLGVSIVTLRRWDDTGKFKARRHPINGYRLYSAAEVRRLRAEVEGERPERSSR
jgi:excisionase family DNA binding protein